MSLWDDEEKRKELESRIDDFKGSERKSSEFTAWTGLSLLGSLGLLIAVSIVAGIALGAYLDRRFHTVPWLTLVGLFAGLGAAAKGGYELVKSTLKGKGLS